MNRLFLICLCGCLLSGCSTYRPYVVPEFSIGSIVAAKGQPSVLRNSRPYIVANQSQIYPGDVLTTDDQSFVHLSLGPNTHLKLGPRSQLMIADFRMKEGSSTGEFTLRSGSVEFSGTGAAKNRLSITTTMALIVANSPTVWLGYSNEGSQLDVVSLGSIPITVRNRDGSAVLDSPLERTAIRARSAPFKVKQWTEKKFNQVRDDHLKITRKAR